MGKERYPTLKLAIAVLPIGPESYRDCLLLIEIEPTAQMCISLSH
jgi:hypothetical protein